MKALHPELYTFRCTLNAGWQNLSSRAKRGTCFFPPPTDPGTTHVGALPVVLQSAGAFEGMSFIIR
jgi:hypothetical protein